MKRIASLIVATLALTACTDAQWGKWEALGDPAWVECYSGTKLIYRGRSTGKVASEANSDGYHFIDSKTGRPMEVSGNCLITYGPQPVSAPDAEVVAP